MDIQGKLRVAAAVLGTIGVCTFWISRRYSKFEILYNIYCTPLGQRWHDQTLKKRRIKGERRHTKCDGSFQIGPRCQVKMVPVLDDNYAYLICDMHSGEVAAVDPADPAEILDALEGLRALQKPDEPQFKLTTILTTHYHHDHAGGNAELSRMIPGLRIVGGANERWGGVKAANVKVMGGDEVVVGELRFKVLLAPGHTIGHVLFYLEADGESALFSGDVLFQGGVGRFFEGSAQQMHHNLYSKVAALPKSTLLFCGHEYTCSNLHFARWLEPENKAAAARLAWAQKQRAEKLPTIPSTLDEEGGFNPFLRVRVLEKRVQDIAEKTEAGSVTWQQQVEGADSVMKREAAILGMIRHFKDNGLDRAAA